MRLRVRSLALFSGIRIWCCRELWCRPTATPLIRPLSLGSSMCHRCGPKKTKIKNKKKSFTIAFILSNKLLTMAKKPNDFLPAYVSCLLLSTSASFPRTCSKCTGLEFSLLSISHLLFLPLSCIPSLLHTTSFIARGSC